MQAKQMEDARPEPLDLGAWVRAIGRLQAVVGADASEDRLARSLRKTFHLAALAPDPLWQSFAPACREQDLESRLGQGDFAAAAEGMMNPELEVAVSKPDGHFTVSIRAPVFAAIGSGAAPDYASTLLVAWIDCIRAAITVAHDPGNHVSPAPRRSQFARHPSSSSH